MFDKLKLTTISWIIGLFLVITTLVILTSATIVQNKIKVIDTTWEIYQTDRSEKARLETALRSEIGYGAMIHDFKNYVLRHKAIYKQQIDFHIGSAEGIINQYKGLDLDEAERLALDDLLAVLIKYSDAAKRIESMISQGHTSSEIDKAVKIDDQPALRALTALRTQGNSASSTLTKSRLAADLRASLGYGGMIHLYKNYLLRFENTPTSLFNGTMVASIQKSIQSSFAVIQQYEQLGPTQAEKFALEDIKNTLAQYLSQVKKISLWAQKNLTTEAIDHKVRVDDTLAMRGLTILDREIYRQLIVQSQNVDDTIHFVGAAIIIGKWVSVATVIISMILILWILRYTVIKPVTQLIGSMVKLADDELDVEIPSYHRHNEIGQMVHSVTVFKKNMQAHQEAENTLASNNELMKLKLDENSQLRSLADEQSRRSLALAENMADARLSTEKMMNQLQDDKALVSSILNAVRDGIITINAKGIIETFNPGAEAIFGYKSIEVVKKNVSMLMPEPLSSEHDGYLVRYLQGDSTRDQSLPFESVAMRKNGEHFPVEVMLNPIEINNEIKITGVIRDITERKNQQEEIRILAMTDPLTGLANRHQYTDSLNTAIKQALRFKTQFALLFIDLDKFKPINDNYGHPVGDALLQHVAKALLASCRDVDLVARLGGDEFVVLALGINEQQEVSILAERVIEALSKPIIIEDNTLKIGASIGISYFPKDSSNIDELTRMADEALYIAKQEGRNTYRYYCGLTSPQEK